MTSCRENPDGSGQIWLGLSSYKNKMPCFRGLSHDTHTHCDDRISALFSGEKMNRGTVSAKLLEDWHIFIVKLFTGGPAR
jgi:hypothetical protein